jgi:hypothetical protein
MSCSANPPSPTGFAVWQGSVPAPLETWAISLLRHVNLSPYGTTWTMEYAGQPVTARKDYHSWTHRNGVLVTGICIPGITLYRATSSAFVDTALAEGDPLATPSLDLAPALFDADDTAPATIDWPLVLLSGGAVAAVVTGFVFALRLAGRR